jgi:hypothetical protein
MKSLIQQYAMDERVDTVKLTDNSKFYPFSRALHKNPKLVPANLWNRVYVGIDPGETTGIAIFDASDYSIHLAQVYTKELEVGYASLNNLLYDLNQSHMLDHVRIEDYKVYGHMTEQHAFASLHTVQLIGAIRVIFLQHGLRWDTKLAIDAKTFWTDDKLKQCGLYNRGLKHARDASRHLIKYMGGVTL